MAQRPKPEEIVSKLRQVDVLVSQGQSVAASIRAIGVTEVTYYRWRKEYGGLKSDQARKMKDLETRERPAPAASGRSDVGEAGSGGRRLGKLLLYSGFIGQCPFVRILVRRVIGPVELLLLSEVGQCRLMMGLEGVGGAI